MINRRIFNHEHALFRDSVRKWAAAELAPHSEQWRAEGMVPKSAWKKAGEQGYLCMWAGAAYGGAGIDDYRYDQILIEELLHVDSGFFLALHNRVVGPYLNNLATGEQKARWLPGCVSGDTILSIAMTEPGTGSDLAGMKTRAENHGDHWLLNGSKTYISNGLISNLCVVAARTNPDAPHAIGLFVVEEGMEGFKRGRKLKTRPAQPGHSRTILPGCESTHSQCAGRAYSGFSQPDAQSRRGTPDRRSRICHARRARV
jgi:acyl-CoA dehydrogenase